MHTRTEGSGQGRRRTRWGVLGVGMAVTLVTGSIVPAQGESASFSVSADVSTGSRRIAAAQERVRERGAASMAATDANGVFTAGSSGISDSVGDVAYNTADITAAGINVGDSNRVALTTTTLVYSDPFTNSDWNRNTGMIWDLDISGDNVPDRYVVMFKAGQFVYAEVYDWNTDAFLCSAFPGLDSVNRTYSASIPLGCLGGTDLVAVRWVAETQFQTSSGTYYSDIAPNSGSSGPVSSSAYRPKVPANSSVVIQVTGAGGVPSTGVSAVSLNITVTQPSIQGYVTAYPCGAVPNASNLNFVSSQTVPNAVIAPVSGAGQVCLFTSSTTHLIVDVNGWFPVSTDFQPITPARLVVTRCGIGGPAGKLPGGTVRTAHVAGFSGVPTSGTGAVVLNVTATSPNSDGFFTVYPCGAVPNASNVNFRAGATVPNMVVSPLDVNGDICIYTSVTSDVIVDVAGSFPVSSTGFQPLTPQRRYDSRGGVRLNPGSPLTLTLAGGGIPASGVGAVSLNVTSTESTASGFITVYPCGTVPNASNVNFIAGISTANAVVAPVTASSQECIASSTATHIIVDVNGWFPVSSSGFQPVTPTRIFDTR